MSRGAQTQTKNISLPPETLGRIPGVEQLSGKAPVPNTLEEAGYTVASLSGELDMTMREEIVALLRPLAESPMPLVDLRDVSYLDSSALGALIGLRKAVARKGNRVSVVVSSRKIRQIFAMTRVEELFDIYETVGAACRKNVHPMVKPTG